MTAKNKRRGNDFERELVKGAEEAGLTAVRAWGSDGRALGKEADVDLLIGDLAIQAKRRKKLASYLQIPDSCDAVAFKQDRKDPLVLITYKNYLKLLTNN